MNTANFGDWPNLIKLNFLEIEVIGNNKNSNNNNN